MSKNNESIDGKCGDPSTAGQIELGWFSVAANLVKDCIGDLSQQDISQASWRRAMIKQSADAHGDCSLDNILKTLMKHR